MMNKCKLILIFSCCLSIDAACENTFTYTYRVRPEFSSVIFDRYHRFEYKNLDEDANRIRDSQIITCSNASLNTSLNYTYENTPNHHLMIVNSTIEVITANSSLFRLNGFNRLTLKYLGIEDIKIGAFDNLLELRELDLSHNKLATIPEEIFNALKNLKRLNVSSNDISYLTNNNFSKTSHLTDLTGNNIKEFESLEHLENIDVSNNPLTKFQELNFKSLVSLVARNTSLKTFDSDLSNLNLFAVDMSNGKLEFMDFDNLPKVRFLHLKNNSLTQIQNLNKLYCQRANLSHNFIPNLDEIPANIQELDLSYNNITKVEYSETNDQTTIVITVLNLGFNEIFKIEPQVFWNLTLLKKLIINNNNLEELYENTVVDCPSLWHIDFSFNKISNIESNAFKGVPALTTLNLSHNKLIVLNFEMLPRGNKVRSLYLNHNEISGLNVLMFQDVFANVNLITINQNSWLCKDLENVLASMRARGIGIIDRAQFAKIYTIDGISCQFGYYEIRNPYLFMRF